MIKGGGVVLTKGKRKGKQRKYLPHEGSGFDFGLLPRAMFASTSSIELNQHMTAARVNGCAYGYDVTTGYPGKIPCLTFIGEIATELVEASKILESWGCHEDGDAVDITILLRSNGSYLLGMGPNQERMSLRMLRDASLVDPIFLGATWIKTLDTTNPILRSWENYVGSPLAPVQVAFATAKAGSDRIPDINSLEPVANTITFVKLDLKIIREEAEPDHMLVQVVDQRAANRGQRGPVDRKPSEVSKARRRVLDTVFPVSRERVRRAKIADEVRALATAGELSSAQIEQAAINLILSREWTGGQDHYIGVPDIEGDWSTRVGRRVEICDGNDAITRLSAPLILRQLEMDVAHTLRKHGVELSHKFSTNQRQFVRLGYA